LPCPCGSRPWRSGCVTAAAPVPTVGPDPVLVQTQMQVFGIVVRPQVVPSVLILLGALLLVAGTGWLLHWDSVPRYESVER
jgi:hypothetical protein